MALDANTFSRLPVAAKVGILAAILAVLALLFYLIFYMGLAGDLKDAEQQQLQLQKDLRIAEEQRKEYITLREELTKREVIDKQFLRILPERAEIPAFLQDLNRLAELSGLKMLLVEPRPEETVEYYTRVPVTLQLSGKYHQLAKFFYHVGRLERATNMENIRLLEPRVSQDEVTLRVDVLATTFRRKPQANAPAPAGGAG